MAMTLRTDSALEEALETLVSRESGSRQEVIRRAVIERASRYEREERIAALSGEAKADWSDTLDRLGTV